MCYIAYLYLNELPVDKSDLIKLSGCADLPIAVFGAVVFVAFMRLK